MISLLIVARSESLAAFCAWATDANENSAVTAAITPTIALLNAIRMAYLAAGRALLAEYRNDVDDRLLAPRFVFVIRACECIDRLRSNATGCSRRRCGARARAGACKRIIIDEIFVTAGYRAVFHSVRREGNIRRVARPYYGGHRGNAEPWTCETIVRTRITVEIACFYFRNITTRVLVVEVTVVATKII